MTAKPTLVETGQIGRAVPNPDLHIHEQQIFGVDTRRHPVTGMVLEQGSGCLSPDEQALRVHLPEILRTQGRAAWEAAYCKLTGGRPPS